MTHNTLIDFIYFEIHFIHRIWKEEKIPTGSQKYKDKQTLPRQTYKQLIKIKTGA